MGLKRKRVQRRQLPATITPSSEEQEDEGSVQTASAVEAPDGSLGAGADDPAEATVTHVSTIAGVIGEEDTTKLFTVTSTETKQSTSTGTAHDADGNTGSSSSDDSESTHAGLIAGLVVGLSVIVLVLALLVWQRWRKGKASTDLHTPTSDRDSFIAEGKDGQGSGSGTLATAAISQPIATEKPSLQKAVTPPPEVRKRPAKGKRKDSSQTNRQSWFSLKSHRTLNNAFNYYRRSTGLDGDEELKELPPTTNYAAMYERASPLSELSEKAAMKMWRSPSTSESLRQGTPKDLKRRDTNLTTLTEDSSYSANNMSSAHRSPFATADDASDYGESFHSANQNMAHISFSGDLPKSTSYMDVQPRQ